MALPFLNGSRLRKDNLVALDLGGRTTKAVELHRSGQRWTLKNYAIADAPIYEKSISSEMLCEHIKAVVQALESKTKSLTIALNVTDSLVRHAEMPILPLSDMRQIVKANPKAYLQQDLQEHTFDCFVTAPAIPQKQTDKGKSPSNGKVKVLVAGARQQLLDSIQMAVKNAGFVSEAIVPGLVGPVNTFEVAMPEVFAKEAVALVDMGFHNTSICLVQEGQIILSRIVNIGGDKLTSGLAQAMSISYAEAEGIKVGIPGEVQSTLESLLIPLGRELRASLDCFEHQQDRSISHVFVCGASARSEFIIQALQMELSVECKAWNPIGGIDVGVPAVKVPDLEQAAPQLAVAVGAALTNY